LNVGYVAYRPATADGEVSYPPGTITSSDALLELARKGSGLFVEDSELLRRLGIPEQIGYRALAKLDRDERSDFPQKNAFSRQRRYWPAVIDFLDATCRPKYLRDTTIPDDVRQTVITRARGFSD
jgi:hypothetical protein